MASCTTAIETSNVHQSTSKFEITSTQQITTTEMQFNNESMNL